MGSASTTTLLITFLFSFAHTQAKPVCTYTIKSTFFNYLKTVSVFVYYIKYKKRDLNNTTSTPSSKKKKKKKKINHLKQYLKMAHASMALIISRG